MTVTAIPFISVDVIGAALMIVFSLLAARRARRLNRKDPDNLVWTYLLWVCICMVGLAFSYSAGHIVREALLIAGRGYVWEAIRPFSSGLNVMFLAAAAAVTLFFSRVWHSYQDIMAEREILQNTRSELMALNQTLEDRVQERTEALLKHEKQMAQTDRLASIGQLSSGIAHEINNPLGVIQGYTQLLLRGETPESQKYQDLQVILKHARNCKTIVADLVSFARRSPFEKTEAGLNEIIGDVLVFVRHRIKKEAVRIETRLDEKVPPMYMDDKKIRQVLINLVMNAHQAVGENGTITISTKMDAPSGTVYISVADDGCGIDEKTRDRIFDPFFTTSPTGEGTGLGLAVSYGIIKNHHGEIRVSSEPGKGSVFTVILPANAARNG